ncbi:glycosyltransferase [Bacteroides gallinaceum]|uniref:glycosyltransferase n=1 Tax=Bacteroides gallinaceum TaxID=1462571 RepID=UPI0025AA4C4A|nr:glycosyltransferase [Bacteroides gallinaceum]MDN0067869.1 glycosyltransferase [Bacteroides gallinaceum]
MKILLSNKFYYRRGGDCIYMLNLEQLLKEHGHEVAVFAMDYPENLDTPWKKYFPSNMNKLMALTRPFGSQEVKRKFGRLLDDFNPDVVHINNVHTQLSPVIAELARKRCIRVVWTLHDYKLLCPRYDCLRDGKEICEKCFGGDKTPCKIYRCMKGSRLASEVGYREAVMWNRERLEACTDLFICPSGFMAEKMAQGGFRKEKLKVLCNFIDTKKCRKDNYDKEDYYCYVGRLSHEKGVTTLIEAAARLPYRLKVIGGGPLLEQLKIKNEQLKGNVEFLGFRQWDDIKNIVGKARFTVIPSEWYENNPLSVIEAQCLGTPVLGARIGGIPELIDEGRNGMTFESGNTNDLTEKIKTMFDVKFDYKGIADVAMKHYNAENYYKEIMKIYE